MEESMSYPTIAEAKKELVELEGEIGDMLNNYASKYNIKIADISIDSTWEAQTFSGKNDRIVLVKIKGELL